MSDGEHKDRGRCQHPRRIRESLWGWASAETVCLGCGTAFDPVEEDRLRRRDRSAADAA